VLKERTVRLVVTPTLLGLVRTGVLGVAEHRAGADEQHAEMGVAALADGAETTA